MFVECPSTCNVQKQHSLLRLTQIHDVAYSLLKLNYLIRNEMTQASKSAKSAAKKLCFALYVLCTLLPCYLKCITQHLFYIDEPAFWIYCQQFIKFGWLPHGDLTKYNSNLRCESDVYHKISHKLKQCVSHHTFRQRR